MPDRDIGESLLAPYRVLDLTDEKGFLCGKILSDLGADVIKIEPPGGDPTRRKGPFYHDIPHPEKSLFWFAYNLGKRGITLDLETADGRGMFTRLVERADFVIESFPPGYLDSLGFGYPQLAGINRRIIMVSITPFGQTGPRRDFKASDLVSMALGGPMSVCGDADRAPVSMSLEQSYLHGSAHGAVGALTAHLYRQVSGQGQHVDVSIQDSLVTVPIYVQQSWSVNQFILRRAGVFRVKQDGLVQRYIWPCADGWVCWWLTGGMLGHHTRALVAWMKEEDMASEFLKGIDWATFDMPKQEQETIDRIGEEVCAFFKRHSRMHLYEQGLRRRILVYPVGTMGDLRQNVQLKARDSWLELDHPELGESLTYPGAFLKTSESRYLVSRRAPLIGENNQDIYGGELGLTSEEITALRQAGVI